MSLKKKIISETIRNFYLLNKISLADLTITIDQYFPLSFEGFLFNEPDQIESQLCAFHIFHLTDGKTSFARFILFIKNGEGKSPYRAPFGSIEFDPDLKYEELIFFINGIDEFCKNNDLKTLSIISYPECYSPSNSQMLTRALLENGFIVTISDLNFHVEIVDQDFEDMVHESEKRRLKKCLKENFELKIETSPDIDEMFALIKDNRESKGFPISMKSEELKSLFENYPGKYFAFTLRDENKLIALSIGVKVNSKILYYFLPADHPMYKNYSPIVVVIKGMYDFCRENKYEMLDFGIATAAGVPNEGLIRFKENLGAKGSLKLSFLKKYQG